MKVPFLDLSRHHAPIEDEVLTRWTEILRSGAFVSGRYVDAFEAVFAAFHEVEHAVAVANGTIALELTWRALGIGHGDRVIVPVSTFIATAEAVSNVGAEPLFVDCEAGTGNIDVEQAIAAMGEPGVVGVVAVHLYGQPSDMDPLMVAARERGLTVVEDAAQAHGARYRNRSVGGIGVAAGFSFYPGKNLGAPGEGGAITTNDAQLAERVRLIVNHGEDRKYHSEVVGTNARMMELVAAMLDAKLPRLAEASASRRRVAARYRDLLEGVEEITLPVEHEWATPVYHLFVVEVADRQRVMDELSSLGVASGLHYPVPLHLQPAYSNLDHERGAFPVAEARADRILSLPMFPEMSDTEIETVAEALVGAVSS